MRIRSPHLLVPLLLLGSLLLLSVSACADGESPDDARESQTPGTADETEPPADGVATALGNGDASLPEREVERGRRDPSWKRFVGIDSAAADTTAGPGGAWPETWDGISPESVNQSTVRVPVAGAAAGPSVVVLQVLLDRARFSPGIIDGHWGKNTEKAVYWFQRRHGLPTTGIGDRATLEALLPEAGRPRRIVRTHTLTEEDVSGPFVEIPEDPQEQAELECMCYESRAEKLAERFHVTRELLRALNPGVDLNAASAGDRLQVPAVVDRPPPSGREVARIVISDGGHYLHARASDGTILYHFPSTLGSQYAPSPGGSYSIESIHPDPAWHYKPDLLTNVPDSLPDAMVPAGPNNPVGVVWMQLSKPHYGIHGTSAPETIGYATSHGCIRLTNWDADFLRRQVTAGVPVEFQDASGRERATVAAGG